jgi:transposase
MSFKKTKPDLVFSPDVKSELIRISHSRTEKSSRVERAKALLKHSEGSTVSAIAKEFSTNRPKIERCIDKALQFGALSALDDLPRSGKPAKISPKAVTWLSQKSPQSLNL